jgi:hypothetical protein
MSDESRLAPVAGQANEVVDDPAERWENALVDGYVRHHFGADPPEATRDTSAPACQSGQVDEDEQFRVHAAELPGRS